MVVFVLLSHLVLCSGVYGEELQCGRHGFSVRDGGFRFDVLAGPYTVSEPEGGREYSSE